MKLVFDPRAVEDLERIHDFIAADNPAAAQAVIDRILTSIERVERDCFRLIQSRSLKLFVCSHDLVRKVCQLFGIMLQANSRPRVAPER